MKPEKTETARRWTEGDLKAQSDIVLSVSCSEVKTVKRCTSRDIWMKLEEIHPSKDPQWKAALSNRLIS